MVDTTKWVCKTHGPKFAQHVGCDLNVKTHGKPTASVILLPQRSSKIKGSVSIFGATNCKRIVDPHGRVRDSYWKCGIEGKSLTKKWLVF